jgi:hypothetical protein
MEASPLEHLIAAFNSFLLFGYLSLSEEEGASIETIHIDSSSDINIGASFFRSLKASPQQLGAIHYTTLIKSNTAVPLLRRIHNEVGQSIRNRLLPNTGLTAFSKLVIE